MTLIQLNNCNSSPNTSQNTINSNIKNLLMIIEDIELKIKTDYEKNYLYAKEEINNILQQVPQLIDSYSLNNTLKYFLKRLLFFSNKFRNENDEIKKIIKNCETLYMQNKYTEGIDKLLVMLNNIKLSAHNNNINNI
jgi:septation ring formation regulator EzrA